ncbi:MAG: hypothetical protein OEZ39_03680 [Gammaproteobacteria bacterium]|nr:hypothetical protein [Gammaproteobacteria bacterium]
MKIYKILILVLMMVFPYAVKADVTCTGSITDIYTYKAGAVSIKGTWGGDIIQICDLAATWKDVPVEVCKVWFSKLLSAKSAQQNVLLSYLDITSCTTIPTYGSAPSPRYIRLVP